MVRKVGKQVEKMMLKFTVRLSIDLQFALNRFYFSAHVNRVETLYEQYGDEMIV